MLRCILFLILSTALVSADISAGDAKKGDDKLEGAWTAIAYRRGDDVPKDKIKTELVISKNTYEYPTGINRISKKGRFKLGDKGTIDFTPDDGPAKGKTLLGIYKIEGDKLTFCFTAAGTERPKEFKSADRMTVLAVYERKK